MPSSVTRVERNDHLVAALVHDPAVLNDPGLLEAVSSAAQLAASNARLQAEVRVRLLELQASRRPRPDEVVPGHNMKPFGGLGSADDRAKIIAYLESVSGGG